MSKHPEDKVLDVIDQLVDESLKKPKDDYNAPFSEACQYCGYEWHGSTNGIGCPGVFATDQQVALWRKAIEEPWRADVRQLMGEDEDECIGVAGAVLGMLLGMGGDTAVFVVMPSCGVMVFPETTQAETLPETGMSELPEGFVDIGFVDESSHHDLLLLDEAHRLNGSDQDICDLDTPES